MNKTALMISVALTAFALIVVAAVFSAVKVPHVATAANVPAASAPESNAPEATAAVEVQLQQAISEREAAYQDLINQANARLASLQSENQALQVQLKEVQNNVQQTSVPVSLSPESAAQVAASWLGDSQIYSVESTMVQGMAAYKVNFSSGAIVYVSAEGQVIGSQAPATTLNVSNGGIQRGGGNEHDEHEGNDD